MKRGSTGSTIVLRSAVLIIGAVVLALCIFGLPAGIKSDASGYYRPILLGLYATAVPFFIALYQTLKLLHHIDKDRAFSQLSVNTLERIKYCAVTIGGMFTAGMPYIYLVADRDDAPGVAALGFVIIFASIVVAVFAGLMQKLLQNAIDIKSENDLTV